MDALVDSISQLWIESHPGQPLRHESDAALWAVGEGLIRDDEFGAVVMVCGLAHLSPAETKKRNKKGRR